MKNNEIYHFLKQFPIFKDLNEYEMEPIIDFAYSREYKAGTIVFMQHEPLTDVYFVQEGKVKIYKTDYEGNEQIVNVLQQSDMFPHQGFFRKGNYPAHAEILKDAILINIPILSFENFLLTHPEISVKMFRVLSEIIIDLQKRLEEKILYNVYDQIILLLLRLARKNGVKVDENWSRLTIHLTNRQLASMIGSSRETISRTLTQLKKENVIKTDSKGYLFVNHTELEEKVLT